MAYATGLPGAVVKRSFADWPVVLAAWLLLVCATTLLATGVVYGDAVATGGLQRALLDAPPATRAVDVALTTAPSGIGALDGSVRPEIERALAATGGEVIRVVDTTAFADAATAPDAVHDLTAFESVDGLEQRATLVAGSWPTAGGSPIQATVSDAAARAMHLAIGDQLSLIGRLDPKPTVAVVISGIWAVDPNDALWLGDPLHATGAATAGTFTTRGPLVIREADLAALSGSVRLAVAWRGLPTIANLRVDGVDRLRDGADGLAGRLRGLVPADAGARVTTGLPALLDDIGRSVLVSRSGVILLTIQFAVLAGYAVVLVAGMLVERRRGEIALMRSRGASAFHLIVMAVIEAALLAVPAAALAPFLAVGVVALLGIVGPTAGLGLTESASIGQGAIIVSAVAGLACILALTAPTLFVSASPAGARAASGRQARTTLAQRLGLDLALVAVAGVALWQLRLYGAPLTKNARGTLGLDPLLVAAPAIGLVGGAVLALRVVPRIAELGENVLVRGRGLVGSLGGRQLARRPLRYTRSALLLMLAAALGTLASAHAATWSRSQADQAAFAAAADVRLTVSDYSALPVWAPGALYRAIPGVTAAMPVTINPLDVGRTIRGGTLASLDPVAAATIGGTEGAAGGAPTGRAAALASLATARETLPLIALPGAPRRAAILVDAAFTADPTVGDGVIRPDAGGLTVGLVLRDGDGRVFRTTTAGGAVDRLNQRLIVTIGDPADPGRQPTGPLSLISIEINIQAADPIAISGNARVTGLEVSDAVAGDIGWAPVSLSGIGPAWSLISATGTGMSAAPVSATDPTAVTVGHNDAIFGGQGGPGTTFRLIAAPSDTPLPALVSQAFLDRTGSALGEDLVVSIKGTAFHVKSVGLTGIFAPFDPTIPLVIVDGATFDALRFAIDGQTRQASEWWLTVRPGDEAAVLAAARAADTGTAAAIGRTELAANLTSDPVPLGLIGVLGLGSIAAMLFAGIGFLVSSTISTSERIGEFALLRALGLSTGQLSLWLSIESVFLLVVGLVAGTILGLILAWLVLPFATLTQTGLAPIPAPVVIVPWQALVPPYLAAIVLFVLSLWLVRRQLPDVRISGVLRAREG